MFHEQTLSVNGIALHHAVGPPNGQPFVFLHGVCRRWQDYGILLASFAARHRVFSLDHRGHGRSSRAARYQVADYIADAVAFVGSLDEPAVLAGHSLGALVALGVADAIPDKVRGIVLEDPPSAAFLSKVSDTSPYAIQFRAMRELAGNCDIAQVAKSLAAIRYTDGSRMGDRRDAASIRFLARCLADLDPNVITPILERRWLGDFDPLTAAAKVKCPAVLLVADVAQGGMLPDPEPLVAAIGDVACVACPGVGHQIHGTRPDLYTQLTMTFLDSL